MDLAALDPRLGELEMRIACDVTNPLLGEQGAAAVYAPQKGAWPEDVAALEEWLAHYADLLEKAAGTRARDIPGAGAAGGTSFGLLCLAPRMRSFELVPGIEVVMQETGFDDRIGDRRPGDHRRGQDRRADRVREDGVGRGPAGGRGRGARVWPSAAGSRRRARRCWLRPGRWRCRSWTGR